MSILKNYKSQKARQKTKRRAPECLKSQNWSFNYKNNKKNQLLLLKTINALIELRQFKTARKLTTEIKSVYEKNLLTVYLCNFQKTRIPNKQMSFLQDF